MLLFPMPCERPSEQALKAPPRSGDAELIGGGHEVRPAIAALALPILKLQMVEAGTAFGETMQESSRDIDRREQGAATANALDQREEFGAVRSLTSRIATDESVKLPGSFFSGLDAGGVKAVDGDEGREDGASGGHKVTKSNDSQEFEFSLSGALADRTGDAELDGISAAEDIFFKGQLLPLNLPTRLEMVQKLSSLKQPEVISKEAPSAPPAPAAAATTPIAGTRLFDPVSLKCLSIGDELQGCMGSALVNSRSSSFHSQGSHNFWEPDSPGELDSGDCTSSRDSSGSSQDACSESEKRAGVPKLFQDHSRSSSEVLATGTRASGGKGLLYSRHLLDGRSCRLPPQQGEKPQISSWLRSSFKWKVFFGLKKPSRFSYIEVGGATATAERGDQCNAKVENPRRDSKEFFAPTSKCGPQPTAAAPNARSSSPTAAAAAVHSKEEQQKGAKEMCVRELEFNAECFSFPGANTGYGYREATAAVTSQPDELTGSGRNAAQPRSREGVHKYFNILKPSLNGRSTSATTPVSQTFQPSVKADPIRRTKSSFSGDLMTYSSRKDTSATTAQSKSVFPNPAAAAQKTAPSANGLEQPRCRSPTSHSLSSNLRIPSFSRGSKTSSTAGKSSSLSHSGPLTSSPSTMAEFQTSIQGAIAHCKQSQSVGK